MDITKSDRVIRSLQWYRDGGYKYVNRQLRTINPVTAPVHMADNFGFYESTDDTIKNLDALTKDSIPKSTTLYRGIRNVDGTAPFLKNPKIGDSFVDNGFVSASPDRQYAINTYSLQTEDSHSLVELNISHGAKGYTVPEKIDPEVLLSRGNKFRITDISSETHHRKSVRIIKVILI